MTINIDSDSNLIWDKATKCIKNIAKEVREKSKGIGLLVWCPGPRPTSSL